MKTSSKGLRCQAGPQAMNVHRWCHTPKQCILSYLPSARLQSCRLPAAQAAADLVACSDRPGHYLRSLASRLGTGSDTEDDVPNIQQQPPGQSSNSCLPATAAEPVAVPPSPSAATTLQSTGRRSSLQQPLVVPSDQVVLHGSPAASPRSQHQAERANSLSLPPKLALAVDEAELAVQRLLAQEQFEAGVHHVLSQRSPSAPSSPPSSPRQVSPVPSSPAPTPPPQHTAPTPTHHVLPVAHASAIAAPITLPQPQITPLPAVTTAAVTAVNTAAIAVAGRAARSLAAGAASLAAALAQGASTLAQAAVEQVKKPDATEELRAQVAALTALNQELAARAEVAEAQAVSLASRLERMRATTSIDAALQAFRRHLGGVPAEVDTSQFYEREEDVIGKGGCGKVYAWRAGGKDWAVKSDAVAYKYRYTGKFEPERLGDLIPALLPAHPNVLSPVAWWSGLAAASQLAGPAAASAAQQQQQQAPPGSTQGAAGFRLYTVWPRYECSLREHMDALAAQAGSSSGADEPLMDAGSIARVIADVAAGLEHLHAHGVQHCDVKPENVMLKLDSEGRVAEAVLIDFGLARLMPPGVDQVDARGGTWLYKAPEQMSGPCGLMPGSSGCTPPVIIRGSTDTWALGALICFMARNGSLPSRSGLPLGVDQGEVAKAGDRPRGASAGGGYEPFYQLWSDLLPPVSLGSEAVRTVQQPLVPLLHQLAQGCMCLEPGERLPLQAVRSAAQRVLARCE